MPTNLGLNATHGAEAWAQFVLNSLSNASVLLASGARRIDITGRKAHIPRVLSDGNVAWTAELAEIPSSAPTGDELVLEPKALKNVVTLSNEAIADAPVDELDTVGEALTRAVATALDVKAFSADATTATAPAGLRSYALPSQAGGVTLDNIIRAVGAIAGAGGVADSVYINPSDLTSLRLAKDADGRPLLQPDLQQPGAEIVAGARIWPTPALPVGTALVAEAAEIVLGVRRDATVDFSAHSRFSADAVQARVVARVDFGINDVNGLVVVTTP